MFNARFLQMGMPAILGLTCAGFAAAQTQEPTPSEAERAITKPSFIRQPPLTVKQKYRYHLRQSFDGLTALRATAGAGIDQWRDHPTGWGQGWDSYGVRVASHFGQHLIKQQILFGVQALDHENPEHLRSRRRGFKNRVIDAVRYTFTSNSDDGKMMPAYSRLVAAYGAAYISRTWYPPEYHTFKQGLSAGSTSLAVDVGMNVLREFGPEIKKRLHRH